MDLSHPAADDVPAGQAASVPYAGAWEHLQNELGIVELLIRAALLKHPPQLSAEIEKYKGLVITEGEVSLLLRQQDSPEDETVALLSTDSPAGAVYSQNITRRGQKTIRRSCEQL